MKLSGSRESDIFRGVTLFVYEERNFSVTLYDGPTLHNTGEHNCHHDFIDLH